MENKKASVCTGCKYFAVCGDIDRVEPCKGYQAGGAMFEELTRAFLQDIENKRNDAKFYLVNGFYPSWSEEHRTDADRGLKEYSTECRWSQYTAGKITREKAIEYAVKRLNKEYDKRKEDGLFKINQAEKAPDLNYASVSVDYVRSQTWGYNPHVESYTDNGRYYGTASGCGYDKESSAVATAFNSDYTMLKVLYTLKEEGLKAGLTSDSKTACTGHDNRSIIGYGAGYSVLPYFEGGVGVGCFWSILKKAGFEVSCNYGKRENFYRITKTATA